MRLRSTVVAAACTLAPLTVRAQPAAPLPFVGPTQSYAVTGCGTGVFGGPPYSRETALCANGTATVGIVPSSLPSSGLLFYQVLFDLTLERQPGFQSPFVFESGEVVYSYLQQVDGAARTFNNPIISRFSLTDTRFTAWPVLDPPAANVAPNSLVLTGGNLTVRYRDPRFPGEMSYIPIAFTFAAITAVPEPSTFALAAAGGLALVGVTRRRATRGRA